jgi:hypothetical protein
VIITNQEVQDKAQAIKAARALDKQQTAVNQTTVNKPETNLPNPKKKRKSSPPIAIKVRIGGRTNQYAIRRRAVPWEWPFV